ncbi:MAG: hypothetical protein ACRDB0_04520 [Paraclostridium sp.]
METIIKLIAILLTLKIGFMVIGFTIEVIMVCIFGFHNISEHIKIKKRKKGIRKNG